MQPNVSTSKTSPIRRTGKIIQKNEKKKEPIREEFNNSRSNKHIKG